MGRMGGYLTREERLRRIGELLLKGVYLWADATEAAAEGENETHAATDGCARIAEPRYAGDEMQTAPPRPGAPRPCGGAECANGADGRRAKQSGKPAPGHPSASRSESRSGANGRKATWKA